MKFALILLTALSAFGQGVPIMNMGTSFGRGADGVMRGTADFSTPKFFPPSVTNAPYYGELVMETSKTLPDGTHLTQHPAGSNQKTWRDSQGRVRVERSIGPLDANGNPAIVQISDPVAGYIYVLDTVNHVAHRVYVDFASRPSAVAPPAGSARPGTANSASSGAVVPAAVVNPVTGAKISPPQVTQQEDLGTRTIDGVVVSGTRTTFVVPAGGIQGNDRPITTTTETWRSKELQLIVLSISNNPANGTSTRKIANLSTAEPDPALFQVPPDYSVVDEKNSFTIKWDEQ